MTPPSPDPRFHVEVLKLLLQVATSDDSVDSKEINQILAAARGMSLPLADLDALARCLQNGAPLPAPNLGLLRSDPEAVVEEVKALISSDGSVHASEIEMLRQIRELLGISG
jgi:uncharacterized tellurite resistance protein B-like protein